MKTNYLFFFFLLVFGFSAKATHNRAGSITYKHIVGNTYEFTIKTCTRIQSQADREELEIKWGDGSLDSIPRINIEPFNIYDVQVNTYVGRHDFSGPGTYIISVEDPNRNSNINNIASSVNVEFCIQTELIISPFLGAPNNSLVIEDCPCPEFACIGETYCYNLSAFDPDGDSLSFSLVPCRGQDCLEMNIPLIYEYPDDVGGGQMSINPVTGTLCWVNPTLTGEYNVAIKVSEYRNGVYIGSVLQDMQISVEACSNQSPVIEEKDDTCVFVGDSVNISFTANDFGDNIDLFATGQIFTASNPAVFNPVNDNNSVTGSLQWTPNCSQASNAPYNVFINAEDNDADIQLSDLLTYQIKVNMPPVLGLQVNAVGGSINISWNPYYPNLNCSDITYNIYKRVDSIFGFSLCCDEGFAEALGFELIGSLDSLTQFSDNDVFVGKEYCYLITAVLPNGTESCISSQVCEKLDFEVPVITNVSVVTTDPTVGSDTIFWSYPKELNLANFPGPYYYELLRNDNFNINTNALVYTSPIGTDITVIDTFFFDTGLNTQDQAYNYQISLYSNNNLVGTSAIASSIFLSSVPNDNELQLNWTENVPWLNEYYRIFKETPVGSGNFVFLDSTTESTYTDTGLVNQETYCYRVESIGDYSQSGIRSPLLNWSQEHCNEPFDFTPPCPPTAFIAGDCNLEETYISWTNPNNTCADDVVGYKLYFAQFEGDSLEFLAEFNSDLDTFYVHKDRGSIAGCYYVTAVDSMPYNNESIPSNLVCIDNCDGFYTLPNVFTPSGDNINDLYHPLLPYKFVESIEINIFNRYGDLVHNSTDPMIDWDGSYLSSGKQVSDGVYYYTCLINVIRLSGIEPFELSGTITVLNSK